MEVPVELEYEGDYAGGQYHGQGTLFRNGKKWKSGIWFRGKLKRGVICDVEGVQIGEQFSVLSYRMGDCFYEGETRIYEGGIKNNKPHGEGTAYFADGSVRYTGSWQRGKQHGRGQGFSDCGTVLHEGDWYYGRFWRENKMYDANGALIYEGQSRKGKAHGTGTLYVSGTIICEGVFVRGVQQGSGRLYKYGFLYYEGEFARGLQQGYGVLYFLQESQRKQFQGSFKRGKREGEGVQFFYNQSVRYVGIWANDSLYGYGAEFHSNGKVKYEGEFKAGRYHGQGKQFNDQGVMVYEGEWIDGVKSGSGKLFNCMGKLVYEGGFNYNMFYGRGVFEDGDIWYGGSFENNMFQGEGKLATKTEIYEGEFRLGAYNGRGSLKQLDSGRVYKGIWFNGVIQEGTVTITEAGKECVGIPVRQGGYYRRGNAEYIGSVKVYEGGWLDDKYHGQGKLFLPNRAKCCEGLFDQGKFVRGKLTILNGPDVIYQGEGKWDQARHDAVRDGIGIEFGANGRQLYSGQWKADKRHGTGTEYLREREFFVGGERLVFGRDVIVASSWNGGRSVGGASFSLPTREVIHVRRRGLVLGELMINEKKQVLKSVAYSDLQCGVCYDKLGVGTAEPLALECGHVFCKQCVTKMKVGEQIKCPMDRVVSQNKDTISVAVQLAIIRSLK